jgi:16S rRNA (uracil1498-N3)-methyltransferase
MALKSVYLADPRIDRNRIYIGDDEHRHLTVGRAEPGELVEVFDGKGRVWTATIEESGRRETVVEIRQYRSVAPDPVVVVLGLALIRSAAFELALEKAVEVGVNRIIPFAATRSNAGSPKGRERCQRIIIEAAKQSKRYHLPVLDDTVSFDQIVITPAASKILFAEHHGGPLKLALFGAPVLYLIGPEGGWTEAEMDKAGQHGFGHVTLGAGILRAETAAAVGGWAIRYELGG